MGYLIVLTGLVVLASLAKVQTSPVKPRDD